LRSARQVLLGVTRTGVRPGAKLSTHLFPLIATVRKALATQSVSFLSSGRRIVLERLDEWLTSHFSSEQQFSINNTQERTLQLRELLSQVIFATGKELLQMTSAPAALVRRYVASSVFVLADPKADPLRIVREQMLAAVADWYEEWRKDPAPGQEPAKARQAEMLVHLLDALESPQIQEAAVEGLMEKEPLETRFFLSFGDTFRTSRWTRQVQREARELVDYHLRIIDQLAIQVQQEDLYYARVFQSLAEASGVGDLSAEAQEPLGEWQAVVSEDMRLVVGPPVWSQEPEPESAVLPPDADELLEEVPEEIEA
jgi:hypothetical protein